MKDQYLKEGGAEVKNDELGITNLLLGHFSLPLANPKSLSKINYIVNYILNYIVFKSHS